MPTLAVIAYETGVADPDLQTILRYCEESGKPVAVHKKPLIIIAPVVNRLHARARSLETTLGSKKTDNEVLKRNIITAFTKVTDLYTIITGIQAPEGSPYNEKLQKEEKFARDLVSFVHELYLKIGGKPEIAWDCVPMSASEQDMYHERLKKFRLSNPVPGFAKADAMKKQGAGCGCLFIILFVLIRSGLIVVIFEWIVELFREVLGG